MMPGRLTIVFAILGLVAGFGFSRGASAQVLVPLAICVEAPAAAANVSAMRKSIRSDCDPFQARNIAITQARANVVNALGGACVGQLSAAERQAICRAQGLRPVPAAGLGFESRAVPGGGNIDAVIGTAGGLCVVLRDLPAQFASTTQQDAICVFSGFKRTIFTARSRGRCGVKCG
jgi:hypothetical protein